MAAPFVVFALSGCTVTVPAAPSASSPVCAEIVRSAPAELSGLPRRETSSQGSVAWGRGENLIVLRCGVTPPGPTTERCTSLEDAAGNRVDVLIETDEKPGEESIVTFRSYGLSPALDMTVPRSAVPGGQVSAPLLELTPLLTKVPVHSRCSG
ncbi:DUF3515 domain-containing protein [Dermabacteraceae bacterium TAE3-ERU27]|nr:DUF3515 domain-containing protein [Dermabacteraceae bacterium TAE3-ERU27]